MLRRPCAECGFDAREIAFVEVPGLVRENAAAWPPVLERPDAVQRSRPDRWSPLEYACHVRDVFRLFDTRLGMMLATDGVRFPNWDQDETAVTDRYGEQDPSIVAVELVAAGDAIAASFAAVTDDQLGRRGIRSDGAEFTIETFARYFVHDPVHHLWDVGAAG